jgi:hypothetical protein
MSRRFASFLTVAALAVATLIMADSPVLARGGGGGHGGGRSGASRSGFNGGGFRNASRGGFNRGGFRNGFRGGFFGGGFYGYGSDLGSYGYGPSYPYDYGYLLMNGEWKKTR